jgi:hypothetical protein
MHPNILIVYKKVPEEVIADFRGSFDDSVSVSLKRERDDCNNFSGPTPDVLIYIDKHLTDIIIGSVSGVVFSETWSLLKIAIESAWKKLCVFYSKKEDQPHEDSNLICLSFKIESDKTLEYRLKGNVDEKLILEATNKLFEHLNDQNKRKADFTNPDFVLTPEEPRLDMLYNYETGEWETVNYAEMKRLYKELLDKANKFD